jgi:hypothetical protein
VSKDMCFWFDFLYFFEKFRAAGVNSISKYIKNV